MSGGADGGVAPLPLADITVLDLTIARAGPTAVRQLADWGADVIRIESPRDGFSTGGHHSPDYVNLHRNKRAMTIDLKADDGRALLHRMIGNADVLVENMRVDVKRRLGFDWDTVSELNPRMVLASISGFGQTGPYSDRGGVDQIAQGLGGMMRVTGLPGQGPVRAGVAISDVTAGLQLAVGILVALHERERTGRGRWVHTSLLESMIGMLDFQAARWTVARDDPPQAGNDHPTAIPMGMYATSDGFINLAASGGRLWEVFCKEIGLPGLLTDDRFDTGRKRSERRDELNQLISDALAQGSTVEWVERLNAVGVPCGPVNTVAEAFADPQVEHLGIAAVMQHDALGDVEVVKNATNLEGVPNVIRRPSPELGEHTDEILAEFGLAAEEIAALRANDVI